MLIFPSNNEQANRYNFVAHKCFIKQGFKDVVFTWQDISQFYGTYDFAFNVEDGRTFLLDGITSQGFVNKYYREKKVITRSPFKYCFIATEIYLQKEPQIQLNSCQTEITCNTIDELLNFLQKYYNTLSFSIDFKNLPCFEKKDLVRLFIKNIYPVIPLNEQELEIYGIAEDNVYAEWDQELRDKELDDYENGMAKMWDEFREESYRETFNNDVSNEWNID